ncbi:MAG: hypothetical protein HQL24_03410 [Candidatus Omnitrophica bacterium]|nr:hypothetical protein [Candidatus Omnitrophota bacterium]
MNQEITATKIAIFRKQEIRKTIHNKEWWLVIVDVVAALTDSVQPDGYIKDMRRRDPELSKGWVQIVHTLAVEIAGDKQRMKNLIGTI